MSHMDQQKNSNLRLNSGKGLVPLHPLCLPLLLGWFRSFDLEGGLLALLLLRDLRQFVDGFHCVVSQRLLVKVEVQFRTCF